MIEALVAFFVAAAFASLVVWPVIDWGLYQK